QLGLGRKRAVRPESRHDRAGCRVEVGTHRGLGIPVAKPGQSLEGDLLGQILGVGTISNPGVNVGVDALELAQRRLRYIARESLASEIHARENLAVERAIPYAWRRGQEGKGLDRHASRPVRGRSPSSRPGGLPD